MQPPAAAKDLHNPLDDPKQLDAAIAQRRERLYQLQSERQAADAQIVQVTTQQKAMLTRQSELQQTLQANDAQRAATLKELDGLLQRRTQALAVKDRAATAAVSVQPLAVAIPPPPAAPQRTQAAPPRAAALPPPAAPPKAPQATVSAPAAHPAGAPPPPALPANRALRAPLAAHVDFTSDSNLFVGFSENVSEGGLFVATRTSLPMGTRVTIALTLPNQSEAIRCETEVAWSQAPSDAAHQSERVAGMGLRFLNLSDTDRDRLRSFVAVREPLFFPG